MEKWHSYFKGEKCRIEDWTTSLIKLVLQDFQAFTISLGKVEDARVLNISQWFFKKLLKRDLNLLMTICFNRGKDQLLRKYSSKL